MPYPNFHACRIRNPSEFQEGSFRSIKQGDVQIIIGRLKGQSTTTTQAVRYPKDSFTEQQARERCREKKGILFEPAITEHAIWEQKTEFQECNEEEILEFKQNIIIDDLPTVDFIGKEIFEAGTWTASNGITKTYTIADLDKMVANYNYLKDRIQPVFRLDHTDDKTHLKKVGAPSIGKIQNIRRMGKKLIADFLKVPYKMAQLIKAGNYRRISADIIPKFKDEGGGGRTYELVIPSAVILGAKMPAVTTLSEVYTELYGTAEPDFIELTPVDDNWDFGFASEHGMVLSFSGASFKPLGIEGGDCMTLEEAIKKIDNLTTRLEVLETGKKDSAKNFAAIAEVLGVDPTDDLVSAAKEIVKDRDESKKSFDEFQSSQEAKEVDQLIEQAKSDKKLLPKNEKAARALILGFKAQAEDGMLSFSNTEGKEIKGTPIEAAKTYFDGLPEIVDFDEKGGNETVKEKKDAKVPDSYAHFCKENEYSMDEDGMETHQKILKISSDKNISYASAVQEYVNSFDQGMEPDYSAEGSLEIIDLDKK